MQTLKQSPFKISPLAFKFTLPSVGKPTPPASPASGGANKQELSLFTRGSTAEPGGRLRNKKLSPPTQAVKPTALLRGAKAPDVANNAPPRCPLTKRRSYLLYSLHKGLMFF